MKKLLCLLFVMWVPASALGENLTQAYCQKVQAYAQDVTPQLPMQMDPATVWAGVRAIYAGGECRIYHDYWLDSDRLVASVAQMEDRERSDVVVWFQSQEGMEALKKGIRASVRRSIPEMMTIPNVVYHADYASKGVLDSFTVELTTETQ